MGVSSKARERLVLEPIADDPEVGRWLAALEDGRRDTLRELKGVTPEMVDWYPEAPLNSIGVLLYHIALIEADWVVTEILGLDDYPHGLKSLLPWADRDDTGHLSRIDGQALDAHMERLQGVREFVLERLRPMSNADFHRVRPLPDYDVAPDWAVHHILQHEAEHRSHIAWLRDTYPSGQNDESAIRAIERERLAALVAGDIVTAERLHADDYELVTPSGRTLSKTAYLGAVGDGSLRYVVFEPASVVRVRITGDTAILRYRATIDFQPIDHPDPVTVWHTDYYERRDGRWQAVWSQATQITGSLPTGSWNRASGAAPRP
jgi:uncharacterized protein DUF4440/DinB family protein